MRALDILDRNIGSYKRISARIALLKSTRDEVAGSIEFELDRRKILKHTGSKGKCYWVSYDQDYIDPKKAKELLTEEQYAELVKSTPVKYVGVS